MGKYVDALKDLQRSLADTSAVATRMIIYRLAEDVLEQGEMMKSMGMTLVQVHLSRQQN